MEATAGGDCVSLCERPSQGEAVEGECRVRREEERSGE